MNPHQREAETVNVPDRLDDWVRAVTYHTSLSAYEAAAVFYHLHGIEEEHLAAYFDATPDAIETWLRSARTEYEKARWLTAYVESTGSGVPFPDAGEPERPPADAFEEYR